MIAPWMQKLTDAAKADPKKTGVLGVLVLVMVILMARALMGGKGLPETASAATATTIGTLAPMDQGQAAGRRSAKVELLEQWTRQPVKGIGRNLFAVQLDYYRREGGATTPARESGGFWEELEKSQARQTDQRRARQVLLENLQLQAAQIKLQSTMMGARPQAMVNGELVAEGGVVTVGPEDNRVVFRVLKIEARSMIVEREGIKLEIQMK